MSDPSEPRGFRLLSADRMARAAGPAATRRAARNAALVLSAVVCLGSLVAGIYLFLDGRLGFEALLAARARQGWPPSARILVGVAALAALVTAGLRLEPARWRDGLFGALSWLGVGTMLGAWAAMTPAAPPPPTWTYMGLLGGMGVGIVLRLLLGNRGLSVGLRDAMLTGVAGAAFVWTSAAF